MPRHDLRMTPAEVETFVQHEDGGVLAHLDEHGDPTAVLVASRGLGTDLGLTAVTAHSLPPDGTQVCVAYEREPSYSGARAVLVIGRLAAGRLVPERSISFDFGKIPAPVREDHH